MSKKLIRFFWGILLAPLALSTFYHLPSLALPFHRDFNASVLLFLGMAVYAVFEVIFSRPIRTYVFGHELTHALASMAIGGRVHSFHVSKKGGNVILSKTNFFVALAPYCVPIYTAFVLVLYFVLQFWLPLEKIQTPALILIGVSLAFHASLTIYAIRQEQPDIKQTGIFFSMIFILLINGWILVLLSKILFWNLFSIRTFFWETMKTQIVIWKWILEQTVIASKRVVGKIHDYYA